MRIKTETGIVLASVVSMNLTNFQEYFAITSEQLSSPNAVRLSGLTFEGEVIQEGWQLRALLLGLGQWDEA